MKRRFLLGVALAAALAGHANAQVSPGGVTGVRGSGSAGYPPGATPTSVSAVAVNAATNANSLALGGITGQYTYICGWNVFTNGGTAQDVNVTVGSFAGATNLNYLLSVPAFSATNATKIGDTYWPCLRGNSIGAGVGIISVPAQGTGNTNVTINVWGYTQ